MSQFSLVSKSNEKGEQFLFRWRYNEFFFLNSWANVESLAEHLNIKLTLLVCQLKLIEIGLLDLGDCEPELLHVDFWHISRGKESFIESSVLDYVKVELENEIRITMDLITKFLRSKFELKLRWMIYLVVLADAAESVRDTIGFEYCLASSSGWTKSPVLWAEIGESSLTGPELVLDMTDKVVLIKEKLKAARDRQKSYADNRRKPLEFEVGDRVMLKVSPWKGVIRFGKKGKLAPRYVGPFEILERVGPVAYRLRLPEELSGIKVDKTLRFVEEPVENSDREVKRLKCSRMVVVKVHLGSKRGL
ncbi:hypothetical protein Tco_0024054 [Tanacetum coccineum]